MNEHKTPEQIAEEIHENRTLSTSRVALMITAINADRAQYAERISSLENEIRHLEAEIKYLTLGEES